MDILPPPSDIGQHVQKFYQLLQRYETVPAAKNFFVVQIDHIPSVITDGQALDNRGNPASITDLGFGRPWRRGIDLTKPQFKSMIGGVPMLIATGVDLNSEKITTASQAEPYKNGLLPTGPYTTGHEYNDTDLDIQFLETNISFLDGIIRPWIQLYSVYGNMQLNENDPKLSTDIDIFFISRQLAPIVTDTRNEQPVDSRSDSPHIRKIYKYYDCIPHEITSAQVNEYTGDFDIGSVSTKWRFSRFDVVIPGTGI